MPSLPKYQNRIAAWRTYRGFSQAELARRIGVNEATIRAWESTRWTPTATHLAMLCSVLRCRGRDLFPDE